MFPAFLTTFFFSLSAVTGTKTARWFGAVEGNFWRLCVAALFLALYAHSLGQGIGGPGFNILFLSGCIGFGADIALFQGFLRLGSRLTILIVHCLTSPLAGITEWIWLGNTLTRPEILFGLTILFGVSLALAPGKHLELNRRKLAAGIGYSLIAANGQAFGAVLSRKAYQVIESSGAQIDGMTTAYQRLLGGIMVTGIILLFIRRREIFQRLTGDRSQSKTEAREKSKVWKKGWLWMIANGLAGPTLGVSCFQWALLSKESGVVLPIIALTPLVVIPMARIVEGERPTTRSLVGGLIAVMGAIGLTLGTL